MRSSSFKGSPVTGHLEWDLTREHKLLDRTPSLILAMSVSQLVSKSFSRSVSKLVRQ